MSTTSPAGLRRRLGRRALGLGEAATFPHGLDGYLGLSLPTWSTRTVRAKVVGVARSTPHTVTLTLRPNGNWAGFRAGQHTQVSVEIDGVRQTRCYSLSGSERDDHLELSIKAHPGGFVSRHLVDTARVGQVIALTTAKGDFTLPAERPARLLLISGGSGITPVMSMLRTLVDEGHEAPVTFLHYALTADDHLYRDELLALAAAHDWLRVVTVYTDAPGTGDLDGFFTAEQLRAAEPEWESAETFVCGPAPLMSSVRGLYADRGLLDRHHQEAFTLAPASAGAAGGTVTFAASGCTSANDGRVILEQAEAAGLTPDNGCRMGICHTCTRRLVTGEVRDVVTGELTSTPDTAIRVCVSAPVGDVTVQL